MDALEDYILSHISDEDPVLVELCRQTHLRVTQPRMISGHLQGRMLGMLVGMMQARKILELGTFTGYSAISMARGFAAGDSAAILHTVDRNDELQGLVTEFVEKAGLDGRIVQHIGSALELVPEKFRGAQFDLVFIDADKREYPEYYRMLMDPANGLLRPGSLMIADNTLWYEKVLSDQVKPGDLQTRGILEFNRMVKADAMGEDARVEVVMIPLRDGMSMIRVKRM